MQGGADVPAGTRGASGSRKTDYANRWFIVVRAALAQKTNEEKTPLRYTRPQRDSETATERERERASPVTPVNGNGRGIVDALLLS